MIYNKQFKVEETLPFLDDIVAQWFNNKYRSLSDPQKKGIPLIHNKQNVLVSSPTGTGKTLTGFLSIINELFKKARNNQLEDKIYCVYISPLKALANDINKNLNEPLREIYALAMEKGLNVPEIKVAVRSGDTAQNERSKMLRKPPHIIITTPESFSLAITASKFKEKFTGVEYVIVDEIHEVSSTKRGSLLSLNLERLENLSPGFVRIGLSATQAPLDLIGSYLCGFKGEKERKFEIIEVNTNKYLDLSIITPVKDLTLVSYEVANEKMYDILVDLVNSHKTTLIFTNTRSSTEHVAMRLKARGIENIEAHHSSLGKQTRIEVEDRLKNGELKCVITSTSLELGIDIGFIDMVIQIGSPKSVSRALQRIGRSGHGVRDLSLGRFIVFDLDDLMECAVMTKAAYDHEIDKVTVPENPLDVLSQGIISMSLEKTWDVNEAYKTIRNSFSFHTLEYEDYIATLKYLSGKIEGNTLFSKIWYDEDENKFGKKASTRMIYFMNVGTIPEEANYNVVNEKGRMLGQLSDKFVERIKTGDIFVLGAKTYMYLKVSKNNITVKSATGMKPTVPSWSGELLPRSYDLGVLIGKFRKTLYDKIKNGEDPEEWLIENYRVDSFGARSLISYVKAQGSFTIPSEDKMYVEGYIDNELYSIIFHIPLGRRVNDALSRAYGLAVSNKYGINTRISVNDNGFMLTLNRRVPINDVVTLLTPLNFKDLVDRSIINTELFKQRFRYCATRSLMVLRKYKATDIPVARQQLRSDRLLRTLEEMHNFPVIKEAFNEVKYEVMDVERAAWFVNDIISKKQYVIRDYSTETSPFSYNLILSGVSDIVLMEDRSKLLRELRSKLLDKIYGTEGIDFLIKDSKLVENYFKNKVPSISDIDDYLEFASHFLYIDPFRPKFNSPLNYTEKNIDELTEELIDSGQLEYCFIRSDQWVLDEYYGLAYNLFRRELELNDIDKKVYSSIEHSSYNELKKIGIGEEDLKDSLIKLESAYLIRKTIKNGIQHYIRNDKRPENMLDSIKQAVSIVLSSYGPLTFDELLIRLPINNEELEGILNKMVRSEGLIFDYITPIFMKQYMMRSDFEAIIRNTSFDISGKRISNFCTDVDTVHDYFEKYGFAFEIYDIKARIKKFTVDELDRLVKSGSVFYTRAIKNKYVYIAKWLADALYKLRDEKNSAEEAQILEYIEKGIDTDEKLTEMTGMEIRIVKAIIKNLQFKIKIVSGPEGIKIYSPESDIDPNKIVEKYGPATTRELSRFFWFHPAKLDYSRLSPIYFKNEIYYGNIPEAPENTSLIVMKNDPVSIYLGKYVRNDDYNAKFIFHGTEESMFYMEEKEPGIWIENIDFETGKTSEFLETLKNSMSKIGIDSIIIRTSNKELLDAGISAGYRTAENVMYRGHFELLDISMEDLLSMSIERYNKTKTTINYKEFSKVFLGVRTDIEAYYTGIRSVEMNNYYSSMLIYNFDGPFNAPAYGTKNVIALYKAIRKRDMTEDEETVYKFLMSRSMSENQLIKSLKMSSFAIKECVKSLYHMNAIAKDNGRKYITIGEEYSRLEAIEILIRELIRRIGFLDMAVYKNLTGMPCDIEYRLSVSKLLHENVIKEVLMPSENRIIYAGTDFHPSKHKMSRIIPPKDILNLIFSDYIKSKYKSASNYLFYSDGSVKISFSVKKSGKYLTVKSTSGDTKYMDAAKTEFNNTGYLISN
ncbi:ATP-dependent helicase [Ferroplasma sp.]|uniref:ATP-dependent helicase n=1 Tax=Ferroplasma sp. TaxID=2591003 RepID=UPI00307D63B5